MPTTEPGRQPAMKGRLHLLDTDLDHVYEMPGEMVELDRLLAIHAAFDVYITERKEQA